MKALRIINLCLVSVLLAILIIIGSSLVITSVKKEEPKEPQIVERTLIQTPFGTISVLQNESPDDEKDESDFSSDGRFVLRFGSYKFEAGFNAGKEDEAQTQSEKSEEGFLERLSANVQDALRTLFGTE